MKYVEFGRTGERVSQIAFGAMGLTEQRAEEGKRAVARAYECGVTLFDTAEMYGFGTSERLLGQAIREAGIPRQKVWIASKCGILFPGRNSTMPYKCYDLSAERIRKSVDESLRNLGTEYIDLYQPHRIDYLAHPRETGAALAELKAAGKIRHVGVSNYTADEIRALAAHMRVESLQTRFSLLHVEPLESPLLACCQELDMAMLCYSPLGAGVLSGAKPLPHSDWRAQLAEGIVRQLEGMAREVGCTLPALALAWLMALPGGVIPIVGMTNPAHVEQAVAACDVALGRAQWYECLVIARGRPVPWHQLPLAYLKDK